jgi:hypothetical protein
MTKFALVDPANKRILYTDYKDINEALETAGLKFGQVDFGTIAEGVGIIVYEYSLNERPQNYFSLGNQLYGGPAVLYGYDEAGETVDFKLPSIDTPKWWGSDIVKIEQAIACGDIIRPRISVNDSVLWEWPARLPPDFTN